MNGFKNVTALVLTIFLTCTLVSQDVPEENEDIQQEEAVPRDTARSTLDAQMYQEIVLEDFEEREYNESHVSIRVTSRQQAEIAIRDVFPAPVRNSQKYLGVKVHGRQGDYATVEFPEPLIIDQHCQSISMWVYGKNFSGELSLILIDADERAHRLSYGSLNFLGWRKLTVRLTSDITQEDQHLSQSRSMRITKMIYSPASRERLASWNYFYVDMISANVREKYQDRQSDDW